MAGLFRVLLMATLLVMAAACSLPEPSGEELTMGQQLEGLLFWEQDEREERFPIMHELFPSHKVARGSRVNALPAGRLLVPDWGDATTVADYMDAHHVAGVMILQDGRVRLREFAPGVEENTHWTSFSVAKSITALLLGAALQQGYVGSMDDRLIDYVPELAEGAYADVNVRQLLTMTSGVRWNEDYEDAESDVAQMYMQPCADDEAHILTYMKTLPAAHAPGEHWNYSTGETDLLGILVQRATGRTLADYLSETIWKLYGMAADGAWLADECDDSNIGGSGLSATLADYARLGQFVLDGARIDGRPVVDPDWLADATRVIQPLDGPDQGYGYLWWVDADGGYSATGIFGQLIYIDPARKLVIAQMAAWPRATSDELTAARAAFIAAVRRAVDAG